MSEKNQDVQHCGHCEGELVWLGNSYAHANQNTSCIAFGGATAPEKEAEASCSCVVVTATDGTPDRIVYCDDHKAAFAAAKAKSPTYQGKAETDVLVEALRPFAALDYHDTWAVIVGDPPSVGCTIRISDIDAARAAIESVFAEKKEEG